MPKIYRNVTKLESCKQGFKKGLQPRFWRQHQDLLQYWGTRQNHKCNCNLKLCVYEECLKTEYTNQIWSSTPHWNFFHSLRSTENLSLTPESSQPRKTSELFQHSPYAMMMMKRQYDEDAHCLFLLYIN